MSENNQDEAASMQPVMTMRGTIGSLNEFRIGNDWCVYEERMEQYFAANYVEENKKVPVLLTIIGEQAYEILRGLCDPQLPKLKTYTQLCTILRNQFSKKVSVFKERINFYEIKQAENESIKNFYVRLKNKAIDCKFGSILNEVLKDRFVSGLSRGPILDRVVEEDHTKDLNDIVEVALNKEATLVTSYAPIHKLSIKPKYSQVDRKEKNGASSSSVNNKKEAKCNSCGETNHNFSTCKYKTFKCNNCKKVGHLAKVCFYKNDVSNHYVEPDMAESQLDFIEMYFISENNIVKPVKVEMSVNDRVVTFELDSGAGISVIPDNLYRELFQNNSKLLQTRVRLKTYDGSIITPEGEIYVKIKYKDLCIENCRLVVIKNGSIPLVGRDLMKLFNFNIQGIISNINNLSENSNNGSLQEILKKYESLFEKKLGLYKYEKVELKVDPGTKPIFCKPRPIPFLFRDSINKELDELEKLKVISLVETSQWGTPLVPVVKDVEGQRKLRLCADYKTTVNKYLQDVRHPLPRIEELFAALEGGQCYSKLDFSNAYNQIELTDTTKKLLSWSTHRGIYQCNRLPYGTKPACAIFQKTVEKVLQGLNGVINFMDDIVVTGGNEVEHLKNLEKVFDRLSKAGFQLNLKKCMFFQPEIKYLGHIINKTGLHKDPEKTRAINECPRPSDVSQVKAYIGMINYYGKFVPKLSTILEPLYKLLRKDVEFIWSKDCERAFVDSKKIMLSEQNLAHFNPSIPIKLSCDASKVGVGAVLLHVYPDGTEKPISFASRVLNKSELGYSVIHKEALAIYWGVRKFYQYLMGNRFILCSDHLPLKALFGENKGIPQMAAGRLQRWALFLSGFSYTFQSIRGTDNGGADGLSRMPVSPTESIEGDYDYLNFLIDQIPISADLIRKEIRTDPILSKVFLYAREGWAEVVTEEIKPYFRRSLEISIENNILMWGYRVLIPTKFRNQLLDEIHGSHNGVVRMKALARQYFWWPNLDADIENYVKSCNACMTHSKTPNKSILIPFETGKYVFDRIHIDFLGPFKGKSFLIMTDAFSKWPEVYEMPRVDTRTTLNKLRECFARYGLPNVIVSDNGLSFVSAEFETFCKNNGIVHLTSVPYHPSTNGAAENSVKSFKQALSKMLADATTASDELSTLISKYLFSYRNTPHCVTNETPSKLMFSRKIKTRFDFLNKSVVDKAKQKQMKYHQGNRFINLQEGEIVYVRDYRYNPNKPTWTKAVVVKKLGLETYLCKPMLEQNVQWRRHLDQIVQVGKFYESTNDYFAKQSNIVNDNVSIELDTPDLVDIENGNEGNVEQAREINKKSLQNGLKEKSEVLEVKENEVSRENKKLEEKAVESESFGSTRPRRVIKPPDRLNL